MHSAYCQRKMLPYSYGIRKQYWHSHFASPTGATGQVYILSALVLKYCLWQIPPWYVQVNEAIETKYLAQGHKHVGRSYRGSNSQHWWSSDYESCLCQRRRTSFTNRGHERHRREIVIASAKCEAERKKASTTASEGTK